MCETLGQMDLEVLNNFCKHLTSDEVSTATVIEMLNRCGDCLAAANASRVNDDVRLSRVVVVVFVVVVRIVVFIDVVVFIVWVIIPVIKAMVAIMII